MTKKSSPRLICVHITLCLAISSVDLNLETQCDRAIEYMLQRLEGVKRERVKEIVPVKFHQRVLF